MYFELHVDTEDRRLTIFALDCFATPSQDRNALPRYDVIKDGYVSHVALYQEALLLRINLRRV